MSVHQFLDEDGEFVQDPKLIELLEKPYHDQGGGYRDINLASRPHAFAEAIDPALFREIVDRVRERSKQLILKSPDVLQKRKAAEDNFAREFVRRERSLSQRNRLHHQMYRCDMPDLNTEREMLRLLREGIYALKMRLDEIGFLVVAGKPPSKLV